MRFTIKQAIAVIVDLAARKFRGKLIISFEKGEITVIKKNESLSPK